MVELSKKMQYSVKHDDEEIIEFSCKKWPTTNNNDTRQKVMTQDKK